jgi:hypothetical protein
LAAELIEFSIFNQDITVGRLLVLKEGLLAQKILIDGFQQPYQVLIPFLTLGCLRLERLERLAFGGGYGPDGAFENYVDAQSIVLDVLADTVNVLSAMSSMPRPAAGN